MYSILSVPDADGSNFEKYWSRKWRQESPVGYGKNFPGLEVNFNLFLGNLLPCSLRLLSLADVEDNPKFVGALLWLSIVGFNNISGVSENTGAFSLPQ